MLNVKAPSCTLCEKHVYFISACREARLALLFITACVCAGKESGSPPPPRKGAC